MCGLAGVFLNDRIVESTLLQTMAHSLSHRGPDDSGLHLDGTLGLVHTRLSIIDIAGGHQPMFAKDGRLTLVANGEIYNYVELRNELEKRGHRFSTHSDCETILHAYVEYGQDFIRHLHGMFAFALYDKAEKKLILVRDRLGMKPLFMIELPDGIAFASELKALLPALPAKPEINSMALLQFLQNQFSSGPDTIMKGVKRIAPGEAVYIEQGRVKKHWQYWSALQVEPREISFKQAIEEFDVLMETVIKEHMRSDVPFGLFLSGGVDSTILLCLLSRYKDEPIRTFSVGFPGSKLGDELSTAESLARHFSSQHTVLQPDGDSMLSRIPRSIWAADELMRDFASLPTLLLAEGAAQELKVVFSGEGGDEVFAGYGRYRAWKAEQWLKNLLAPGSGGFRTHGNFPWYLARQVFGQELQALDGRWREPVTGAWCETPSTWSNLKRQQYTDLKTALPDNLMVKADRMLMAWSIEGRLPFLDHRVVEFGLSLPDSLKIEGPQGKVFLKRWASRFLPNEHLWHKKRGFSVPVGEWLQGEYLDRMEVLLGKQAVIRQWFKQDGIKQLMERQRRRGDVTKNVFALLQIAIWYKLFVEGNREAPPLMCDPLEFLS